ncbi:MAG: DUF2852 domain-containing protein [Alphaproteobacteria bacterium]
MISAQTLRPDWTPITIAMMVIGFIVAWPLGLAMLAYILWGDRIPEVRKHFAMAKSEGWNSQRWNSQRCGPRMRTRSGNVAFDQYRQRELERLEEERRKLDGELQEFERFMNDLRRARDEEEFERFRRDRSRRADDNGGAETTIEL